MSNLVLPSNYVEIENEEMEYVDGGYYISNSTLKGIVFSGVGASAGVSVLQLKRVFMVLRLHWLLLFLL